MSYSQIRDKFFETGFVHINTGQEKFDNRAVDDILENFGKTLIVGKHHAKEDRRLQIVSEEEMFGSDYLHWHTDQSYSPGNYNGTLLAFGGSDHETYTEFADMNKAYDSLQSCALEYFESITCTYGIPHNLDDLIHPAQKRLIERNKATWNLIETHPITKKKSIYFSPLTFVSSNKKFGKKELLEHCEKYTFKHHWNPGDIILWDNRRVIHRRPAFTGHRQLFRTNFTYE